MKIIHTAIESVIVVDAEPIDDARGAFAHLYCERELADVIGERRVVQITHLPTSPVGAIRGLYFQYAPQAKMKLVRCLKGKVWDVAVDLRAGSPTFLAWHAGKLDPGSGRMLVIPEGCDHGFQMLSPDNELLYLHTAFYMPDHGDGVRYDDSLAAGGEGHLAARYSPFPACRRFSRIPCMNYRHPLTHRFLDLGWRRCVDLPEVLSRAYATCLANSEGATA